MSYVNSIWLQRRLQPDCFAQPGPPDAKRAGTLHPRAAPRAPGKAAEDEPRARAAAEQHAFEREVLALRREFASLKLEYELRRFQQKYSPNQPRVPAGNPDSGQWTSGGGAAARTRVADARDRIAPRGPVLSDATPDPVRPGAQYAQTQIAIDASALTGISRVDETTRALADKLAATADTIPKGFGPLYGTLVHKTFELELRLGAVPGVEVTDIESTFGGTGRYGSKGSVRPDIVPRNEAGDIMAVYDVKTGRGEIDDARAQRLRNVIGIGPRIPIIELHLDRGVSRKSLWIARVVR